MHSPRSHTPESILQKEYFLENLFSRKLISFVGIYFGSLLDYVNLKLQLVCEIIFSLLSTDSKPKFYVIERKVPNTYLNKLIYYKRRNGKTSRIILYCQKLDRNRGMNGSLLLEKMITLLFRKMTLGLLIQALFQGIKFPKSYV